MDLNSIIFPAPKCSYTKESRNIIWIESNEIHTPVFHHNTIKNNKNNNNNNNDNNINNNEQNKENRLKRSKSFKSGPFSSCISSNNDQDTEIEIQQSQSQQQQQQQQNNQMNRQYSFQSNNDKDIQQSGVSLCSKNLFCDSQKINTTTQISSQTSLQEYPYSNYSNQYNKDHQQNNHISKDNHKNNNHNNNKNPNAPQKLQNLSPSKKMSDHYHSLRNSENSINHNNNNIKDYGQENNYINTKNDNKQQQQDQNKKTTTSQQSKIIPLHSPIRPKTKHTTNSNKEDSINNQITSPLRQAAEFGPCLTNANKTQIPCLYLPYFEGSDKLIIYFHGNAEDLGYSYEFVSNLRRYLRVNVLAVEYPGYGLYTGSPNSDQILQDADSVYEFVRTHLQVQSKNIIIFGRSIGSGPACYLSGTRNIGGLILMCPYTSIRNVVKHLAGTIIQYLVAERFRNIDYIKHSHCATLFIHGKMDKLIPYQHSLDLMECVKDRALIHLSPQMTHNEFSITHDLINPIKTFFCQAKIIPNKQKIHIPPQFYIHPDDIQDQQGNSINNNNAHSVANITARIL